MLNAKKALLLIGSPKVKNSTSEALGNYLLEGLHKKGCICETLSIVSMLKNKEHELLDRVQDTDILIISFPLYIDSLPSPLIRAFELIDHSRNENRVDKKQSLIAIVNSGFPEAIQSDTALKICKKFGEKTGFTWLGGLTMGSGSVINGKPIEQLGGMTKNIIKALNLATEAIANDEGIPSEAIDLMTSKLMPVWLYSFIGNFSWKTQAKKFNMHKQLYAKPYIKE